MILQAFITSCMTIALYALVLNILAYIRYKRNKPVYIEIDLDEDLSGFEIKTDKKVKKLH